jgi:hypothetical protein
MRHAVVNVKNFIVNYDALFLLLPSFYCSLSILSPPFMTQLHQKQALTTRPQSLIARERIAAAFSYEEYFWLSEELFAQGRTILRRR